MTSGNGGGTPYDQDSDQNLLNDDEEFFSAAQIHSPTQNSG